MDKQYILSKEKQLQQQVALQPQVLLEQLLINHLEQQMQHKTLQLLELEHNNLIHSLAWEAWAAEWVVEWEAWVDSQAWQQEVVLQEWEECHKWTLR